MIFFAVLASIIFGMYQIRRTLCELVKVFRNMSKQDNDAKRGFVIIDFNKIINTLSIIVAIVSR